MDCPEPTTPSLPLVWPQESVSKWYSYRGAQLPPALQMHSSPAVWWGQTQAWTYSLVSCGLYQLLEASTSGFKVSFLCPKNGLCLPINFFLEGGWEKWGRTAKDLSPARLNKGSLHAREYFQKTTFQLCSTLSFCSESLISKFVKMKAESNILYISKTSPSTLSCFNIKSQHLLYP